MYLNDYDGLSGGWLQKQFKQIGNFVGKIVKPVAAGAAI